MMSLAIVAGGVLVSWMVCGVLGVTEALTELVGPL